ncbi:hypothetical protein Lalb_Chr23g0278071 [Lupinus albus]|uniref:Uncharacterized protein n=1 Tax=Lupinus albus TaxID=3870 RepID=A0A6A4MYC1_LUPAL|nr:hypothetical protein Lalb_Chr23g0278071 [Lupinus albus]
MNIDNYHVNDLLLCVLCVWSMLIPLQVGGRSKNVLVRSLEAFFFFEVLLSTLFVI